MRLFIRQKMERGVFWNYLRWILTGYNFLIWRILLIFVRLCLSLTMESISWHLSLKIWYHLFTRICRIWQEWIWELITSQLSHAQTARLLYTRAVLFCPQISSLPSKGQVLYPSSQTGKTAATHPLHFWTIFRWSMIVFSKIKCTNSVKPLSGTVLLIESVFLLLEPIACGSNTHPWVRRIIRSLFPSLTKSFVGWSPTRHWLPALK